MTRSDSVYLKDIRDSIDTIFIYIAQKSEHDFLIEQMVQDAVIRRFEIIGEAASKISDEFKNDNSGINWKLMKAMRNKLIHEYFGVSASTVYHTIKMDLPVLRKQIVSISTK